MHYSFLGAPSFSAVSVSWGEFTRHTSVVGWEVLYSGVPTSFVVVTHSAKKKAPAGADASLMEWYYLRGRQSFTAPG